jgi:hypothetical protein
MHRFDRHELSIGRANRFRGIGVNLRPAGPGGFGDGVGNFL